MRNCGVGCADELYFPLLSDFSSPIKILRKIKIVVQRKSIEEISIAAKRLHNSSFLIPNS